MFPFFCQVSREETDLSFQVKEGDWKQVEERSLFAFSVFFVFFSTHITSIGYLRRA